LYFAAAEAADVTCGAHEGDAVVDRCLHGEADAVDVALLQQGLRGQVDVLQMEITLADDEAFANVVATAEQTESNAKAAMLIEEDAGFEGPVLVDENGGALTIGERVRGKEVFRFGGAVIFLATAPAELLNVCQMGEDLPIADNEFGDSWPFDNYGDQASGLRPDGR
jgi:hypothetical protein